MPNLSGRSRLPDLHGKELTGQVLHLPNSGLTETALHPVPLLRLDTELVADLQIE
jgi:hypothetical protein